MNCPVDHQYLSSYTSVPNRHSSRAKPPRVKRHQKVWIIISLPFQAWRITAKRSQAAKSTISSFLLCSSFLLFFFSLLPPTFLSSSFLLSLFSYRRVRLAPGELIFFCSSISSCSFLLLLLFRSSLFSFLLPSSLLLPSLSLLPSSFLPAPLSCLLLFLPKCSFFLLSFLPPSSEFRRLWLHRFLSPPQ